MRLRKNSIRNFENTEKSSLIIAMIENITRDKALIIHGQQQNNKE